MEIPPTPPGDDDDACGTCLGTGVITDTSSDTDIAPVVECPECHGSGRA